MDNLFIQTSYGVGSITTDSGIKPCNFGLPEKLRREDAGEFTTFIFGHPLSNLNDAKSPLFRCRDLIAHLRCNYIGKTRDNLRAEHLNDACYLVDELFKGKTKEIVVINNFSIDTDDENAQDLFSNLYSIIYNEVKKHYNDVGSDIAICMFCNKEQLEYVKKFEHDSAMYVAEKMSAILFCFFL